MNATVVLPPEVAAYLDQVRAALADVPAEERDELLADVEVSLVEGAADGPPEVRLGPPEQFARELRAAAGIATVAPATTPAFRDGIAALAAGPRARAALDTARELAPAWWVLRGYVAACAVALFGGLNWSEQYALVPVRGAPQLGMLMVLAGLVASVWLGLRARREDRHGGWLRVLNIALAMIAIPVLTQAVDGRASLSVVTEQYLETPPQTGVAVNGEAVRNIYPYSRDGKLLLDVLLYDDLGRPLDIGSRDLQQDPLRRYLFADSGAPVLNAFPIRYMEANSQRVEDPSAAPDIELPKIETPPLKVRRP